MRLLVIEDDVSLLQQISTQLSEEGFVIDRASDGEEGLHFCLEYPIDLAIVDLGLPHLSGIEVIQKTRQAAKNFPILILTARSRWQEKVDGLEAGADDYLVKPFEMQELLARVRALLRRSGGWAQSKIQCGPITLDLTAKSVTCNERKVELTSFEYKVLAYLMLHAGETVSKTTLSEHIYDEEHDRDSNVIEVFVRRLRQKLDPRNEMKPIETQRGLGYRFTLPREAPEATS